MPMSCPSCRDEMQAEEYAGHYGSKVEIDVCHRCNALWFDKMENLALSPGSVISLIKSMHDHHYDDRGRLARLLFCPRCDGRLRESPRLALDIRYKVHDCPGGHGHFITFYNFLREKDCIRPLRGQKLKELRKHVSTVACSNCGAPVDLHRTTECTHCQAPLALLDPDAMAETLTRLGAVAERRADPNPDMVVADMVLARLKTERNFRENERLAGRYSSMKPRRGAGLLEAAFAAIARLLS